MRINMYELNQYLKQQSEKICELNECTEDEHKCESYAYINIYGQVMDVCISDCWMGFDGPYAAIPLPWDSSEEELLREIKDQLIEENEKFKDTPEYSKNLEVINGFNDTMDGLARYSCNECGKKLVGQFEGNNLINRTEANTLPQPIIGRKIPGGEILCNACVNHRIGKGN